MAGIAVEITDDEATHPHVRARLFASLTFAPGGIDSCRPPARPAVFDSTGGCADDSDDLILFRVSPVWRDTVCRAIL